MLPVENRNHRIILSLNSRDSVIYKELGKKVCFCADFEEIVSVSLVDDLVLVIEFTNGDIRIDLTTEEFNRLLENVNSCSSDTEEKLG
ncbi:MAG: hypothetical protein ACFFD4_26045 [Candidatus Odinarchaeota archaeon]